MRVKKELIKNKKFYKMCREQFKLDDTTLPFKRWVITKWNDLVEAFEYMGN